MKSEGRGKIPAYIQLAAALRRRIENQGWLPGEQISTLEELMEEFNVARVTVRQAVELLEQEGLVKRQQGRGTFVTDTISDRRWLRLETRWDAVIDSIRGSILRFIKVANPPRFPRLADGDGKPADDYVFLRSVQLKDGVPYGVASVHVDRALFDRERERFLKQPGLAVLADMKVQIKRAHQSLTIGTADPEIADLMHVSLSAPTVEARWVVNNKSGVAIYVGEITYRADCVRMSIDFF